MKLLDSNKKKITKITIGNYIGIMNILDYYNQYIHLNALLLAVFSMINI